MRAAAKRARVAMRVRRNARASLCLPQGLLASLLRFAVTRFAGPCGRQSAWTARSGGGERPRRRPRSGCVPRSCRTPPWSGDAACAGSGSSSAPPRSRAGRRPEASAGAGRRLEGRYGPHRRHDRADRPGSRHRLASHTHRDQDSRGYRRPVPNPGPGPGGHLRFSAPDHRDPVRRACPWDGRFLGRSHEQGPSAGHRSGVARGSPVPVRRLPELKLRAVAPAVSFSGQAQAA
jgi:hypothetical protein